jgi:fimbrial chaperone protein
VISCGDRLRALAPHRVNPSLPRRRTPGALLLAALLAAALAAGAASFGIAPIRLDFDRDTRTGVITVNNDDTIRETFQVRLMRWTQDAKGADHYEDSSDLVYFPRLMTVEPKDKRVIRIGSRGEPAANEKAYRLYVEEISEGTATAQAGSTIAVRMRFALPVFVAPAGKAETRADVVDATFDKGQAHIRVHNGGNRSFKVETITLRDGDTQVAEVAGWYVLAGATRDFAVPIPHDACARLKSVEAQLKNESLDLRRTIAIDPARCGP